MASFCSLSVVHVLFIGVQVEHQLGNVQEMCCTFGLKGNHPAGGVQSEPTESTTQLGDWGVHLASHENEEKCFGGKPQQLLVVYANCVYIETELALTAICENTAIHTQSDT